MKNPKILLTIGVWVAVLPYLGFPSVLKNILFLITGLVIIYFSYKLYQNNKKDKSQEPKQSDSFSENKDFNKIEQ